MSIDINWDNLVSDEQFTSSLRTFLDDQFRLISLPLFINNLQVTDFCLGTKPPNITIRHIGDPFDAFYEEESPEAQMPVSRVASNVPDSDDSESIDSEDEMMTIGENTTMAASTFHMEPPLLPPSTPRHRSLLPGPHPLASTRTSLDSVSLMVGTTQLLNLHQNYTSLVGLPRGIKPPEPPGANGHNSALGRETPLDILTHRNDRLQLGKKTKQRHVNDIQFTVEFDYQGDMTIEVTVNLLVNYPSPNFISLPIKLHITDMVIHLIAAVAYLKHLVYFSFLCDINDNIADYFDGASLTPANATFSDFASGRDRIDIIKKIRIELEIGEVENNVLRNVGKVERFLTEHLRSMLRDEIAWPSWLCFDLNDDENDDDDGASDTEPR